MRVQLGGGEFSVFGPPWANAFGCTNVNCVDFYVDEYIYNFWAR